MANARVFEALEPDEPVREEPLAQMKELLPGLKAVVVLDVFAPRSSVLADALAIA